MRPFPRQVAVTLLSVNLMDRAGRRVLLIGSAVGMVVAVGLLTLALSNPGHTWTSPLAVLAVVSFVMSFGIGMGPVPWLLPAELVAMDKCAKGSGLAASSNWLANFLVVQARPPRHRHPASATVPTTATTPVSASASANASASVSAPRLRLHLHFHAPIQAFPSLSNTLAGFCFLPFAAVLLVFIGFAYAYVPETRGKTLEQILQEISGPKPGRLHNLRKDDPWNAY